MIKIEKQSVDDAKNLRHKAKALVKRFQVTDGRSFRLKDWVPRDLAGFTSEDKPRAKRALASGITLLAIAAENHMAVSMLLLFKKSKPDQKIFSSKYVSKEIKSEGPELAALLSRLMGDHNWKWVRELRERWFHLNPVRVRELGLQWTTQFEREFLQTDRAKGTQTLGFGGGDPCEIDVEEMLTRGRDAFSLFARQFGTYVTVLDEKIRTDWQNWDPFQGMIKHKLPRRRCIQWLIRE